MKQKASKSRKWYRQSPRREVCKQYVISVEEDIYENFKEYAFQNGHSINSMVGELIKKALRSESRSRRKTAKREPPSDPADLETTMKNAARPN